MSDGTLGCAVGLRGDVPLPFAGESEVGAFPLVTGTAGVTAVGWFVMMGRSALVRGGDGVAAVDGAPPPAAVPVATVFEVATGLGELGLGEGEGDGDGEGCVSGPTPPLPGAPAALTVGWVSGVLLATAAASPAVAVGCRATRALAAAFTSSGPGIAADSVASEVDSSVGR